MFGVAEPMWLLLLPLVALPLFAHGQKKLTYSSVALLPADRLSDWLGVLIRLVAASAIVAMVLGIAGLFRAEQSHDRIGEGAQMIMLLDSSGSMDRPFVTGNESSSRAAVWGTYTSKGQIARDLLAKYAAEREQDMFAMFVFSGNPIAVLPFTEKQAVVQSAIAAGRIERGLASTNLGAGLIQALEFFEGKPFTGSRIVMLVSDGAASLTLPIQDRVQQLMEKHRVTLYWMYLRDQHSPGLYSELADARAQDIAPEQLVHKFFSETGLPYRAYSAENPQALENAIGEVSKLQNLPIRYRDIVPKKDLSSLCYALGLCMLALLFAAKISEIQVWK